VPAYQRPPASPPRIVLGGDTDPLMKKAESAPDEITDPELERTGRTGASPMGILLVTALAASLLVSLVLWVKLLRVRDDLADAEAGQQETVASQMSSLPVPPETTAATVADGTPGNLKPDFPKSQPARPKLTAAAQPERLLLLVTVGSQHFAEKQLRELKKKCKAPLAVYQQKGGRCAWSTCFAIAALESDASLAQNCGVTKGESLRERKDFVPVQSNR
jgi:hypothetical protein